jgi:hypothetical protein
VTYTVMPQAITVHPAWNGDAEDGNDIALLTLPTLAPSGPKGLGATGYLPYADFDEVGKQFEFAGFGRTGSGSTGGMPGTQGTGKRYGYNRFDIRTKPIPIIGSDTGLAFDYDDGTIFNNTIETIFHIDSPKTPVKSGDSMIAQGDSGGPSFLNGYIAGVTSKVYAVNDFDPDGSFGDIGAVERVTTSSSAWTSSGPPTGSRIRSSCCARGTTSSSTSTTSSTTPRGCPGCPASPSSAAVTARTSSSTATFRWS